jgi:UDP:flavonoid glycosyltransferase YjiC (YdhE family)
VARILLAWELGANLGHLGPLVVLARALRSHGHEVTFVLRDLSGAERALAGFAYAQAPVSRPSARSAVPMPCSYAEIMERSGFADRESLLAMVRAWRQIFKWTAPDVMVFDHAPTALLAARGLPMSRVLYGVGFSSPPRVSPLPSFRTWQHVSIERLQASESTVLGTINWVLAQLGVEGLAALHELFAADEELFCTFAELDHYSARATGRYCGPIFYSGGGGPALWHESDRKKLFVYMRPEMPGFRPLAHALADLPYRVLWVAPGAEPEVLRRYQTPTIRFVSQPVDLAAAAAQADGAVLYGGHGTAAGMLLAGVPLTLCPNHVEQMLVARNVARLGAGTIVMPGTGVDDVRASIEAMVEGTAFRQGARAFASKYDGFTPQDAIGSALTRIHACSERAHA